MGMYNVSQHYLCEMQKYFLECMQKSLSFLKNVQTTTSEISVQLHGSRITEH